MLRFKLWYLLGPVAPNSVKLSVNLPLVIFQPQVSYFSRCTKLWQATSP